MEFDLSTNANVEFNFSTPAGITDEMNAGTVPSGIDEVKVDGTPLPVIDKSVNIDLATPLSTKADKSQIPTKTSQLQNDSGYITKDVDNLTYYTKTSDLPAPITVDTGLNNASTNPVQNKALYDAIVGKEITFQVNASDWSTPSGTNPYTTVAIVTLPAGSFTNNCTIELMIDDKFNFFAKYGFVLYGYEVSSQRLWLTALDKPTQNLYLKVRVFNYGS